MIYSKQKILEVNPHAILWDDLDNAIIGITEDGRVVYDIHKMEIEIWNSSKDMMSFEEASEWVEYNILNAYLGDFTPLHIWTIPKENY